MNYDSSIPKKDIIIKIKDNIFSVFDNDKLKTKLLGNCISCQSSNNMLRTFCPSSEIMFINLYSKLEEQNKKIDELIKILKIFA